VKLMFWKKKKKICQRTNITSHEFIQGKSDIGIEIMRLKMDKPIRKAKKDK
jgi:hypothetical protein